MRMKPQTVSRQDKTALSRRAFLGHAAAATAATVLPRHVLGGEGQMAPSAKITLAGIGMGGQGLQDLNAFLQFSEVQVVAVCDVQREADGFLSWNWSQGK